jgi:AmmeMemoRadiSam system protein B
MPPGRDDQPPTSSNTFDPKARLRLRNVEAHAVELEGRSGFALRDPTGLSEHLLTISEPVLFVLAHFDGAHTLGEVQLAFAERYGQQLDDESLAGIVEAVRSARFLGGKEFETYYAECVAAYRAAPTRPMRSAADLDLAENAPAVLDDLLASAPPNGAPPASAIAGVIAPHLDYPRGRPCYAAAYSALRGRPAPRRVIILGTNHFGRSTSVVATRKPFSTPLGTTPVDTEFLNRLEAACGDLCHFEMDHAREHSVELQLLFCQHLWGADSFSFVPVLCPDPCGPTGTAPWDGNGVDLADFARALGELIRDDPVDTLVIAGADLSHVGRHFGDERELDDAFAAEVEQRDRAALTRVAAQAPTEFVAAVADESNPTRVCSAGCIFAAMEALAGAQAHLLGYHQAFDREAGVGVTCCAAAFTR